MAKEFEPVVCVTEIVTAPAAALWSVFSDFEHPQRLAPSIGRCRTTGSGVGAVRLVESARGLAIEEQLLICDADAYRFQYEALATGDMPFENVEGYRATITLAPLSGTSTQVSWRAEGLVDGDATAATAFFESLYRGAIVRAAMLAHSGGNA